MKLDLDDDTLKLLDSGYDKLAEEGAEEQDIKRSKDENARLHALLSAPQTIDTLCKDIIDHYENNRADQLTGKAMIVAIDRATGIDIYKKTDRTSSTVERDYRCGYDARISINWFIINPQLVIGIVHFFSIKFGDRFKLL
ncbi:hypothetical protein JN06_01732 [Bacteroides zoogleoformans]|uniref:hypothetical protein n=1 Tax=Bacteroides zoogleoformans TaxID=28119 RepID=UPI0011AC4D06|nr:hypothetical protein [Bacteroides zoogleoformans]TWJ13856.1 hypothetical protein JN06_01732 [Bacteroides zoogleoformans]